MYLGETLSIREEVRSADESAFVITSATFEAFNSAGTSVHGPAAATVDDTDTTAQIVLYPWTPSAVGIYRGVFVVIIGAQTRLFPQTISVRSKFTGAGYPIDADLADRIEALGILATGEGWGFDLGAKVGAAIADWERDTGHLPFLAASSMSVHYFDPPRRSCRLDFDGGLASLSSLTISGTTLTVDEDFFLMPTNAAARGLPITGVEFAAPVSGEPRSIAVTGRWGYATTLPDAAYEAILCKALLYSQPELALGVSKGVYSVQDEKFSMRYGGGGVTPLMAETERWRCSYRDAVRRYRRIAL
jgi:hypothetical protein